MPSVKACPGADRKVMALACVPIMLSSTRYHGMLRLLRKYPSILLVVRLLYSPYTTIVASVMINTIQSVVLMKNI